VPEGKTMCSLCSRLRRGILYNVASELGATKVALGHHRDDMVQTLFMNMFFNGRMKGMPPKLVSDDGRHVVIRPLAYVAEDDLAALGRRTGSSRSSRATCAAARRTCSASRSAHAARVGEGAARAGPTGSSGR
jgi:tRNA(Ile)-lysidine synthase TilS/MesJ